MGEQDMDGQQAFIAQTQALAVRIIRMVEALPQGRASDLIGSQVVRAATDIGRHYRARHRATTKTEQAAALKATAEAADETLYWLELIIAAELMAETRLTELMADLGSITESIATEIQAQRSRKKS